jgi:CheY-like chemotaxis protein
VTPPQILAIEPDRWRASQLKAIARRIGAELRLTDSMDGALAALSEQTPDLILTPALLSARDDQALTDRLRSLGEAAAHIQTLTIPTLHTAELSGAELSLSSTRMFAALRTDKSRPIGPGPAACDPDTFAEQVAFYLIGATEARRKRAPASGPTESAASVKPSQAVAPDAIEASFEELDLTAFMSEELLDPTPVHSISAPANAEDLTTVRAELEAALSKAVANTPLDEFQDFLPEDLTADVPAGVPVRSVLSEFESEEDPPRGRVLSEQDDWQFFDPSKPRFAALLAKLDEIAGRSV